MAHSPRDSFILANYGAEAIAYSQARNREELPWQAPVRRYPLVGVHIELRVELLQCVTVGYEPQGCQVTDNLSLVCPSRIRIYAASA